MATPGGERWCIALSPAASSGRSHDELGRLLLISGTWKRRPLPPYGSGERLIEQLNLQVERPRALGHDGQLQEPGLSNVIDVQSAVAVRGPDAFAPSRAPRHTYGRKRARLVCAWVGRADHRDGHTWYYVFTV